MASILFDPVKA